jgi:hypothetical protein
MVGGVAAGALYGLLGLQRSRRQVLVPHGGVHVNPFARVIQTRHLPERRWVEGFPVAPIERVICDLAREVTVRQLGGIIDDAAVRGFTTLPRIERVFLTLAVPAWPGVHQMTEALRWRSEGYVPARSDLERAMRLIATTIPGPPPSFEVQIGDRSDMAQIVDCVFEEDRLILEVDGRSFHARLADFERDRRRDRRASRLGYTTWRFTYHEVMSDPESVWREICTFLGR